MNYNINSNLFSLKINRYTNDDFHVGGNSSTTTLSPNRRKFKYSNDNKVIINKNYDKFNNNNSGYSHQNNYKSNHGLLKEQQHVLSSRSNSNQKSYWKNSNNIRINPKNLAPEYYQKYMTSTSPSPSTLNDITKSINNYFDDTFSLEKSKLPKIKSEKKNGILGKKKIPKNNNFDLELKNIMNDTIGSDKFSQKYLNSSDDIILNDHLYNNSNSHNNHYIDNDSGKSLRNNDSPTPVSFSPNSKKIVFDQDGNLLKSFDYNEEILYKKENYIQATSDINCYDDRNKKASSNILNNIIPNVGERGVASSIGNDYSLKSYLFNEKSKSEAPKLNKLPSVTNGYIIKNTSLLNHKISSKISGEKDKRHPPTQKLEKINVNVNRVYNNQYQQPPVNSMDHIISNTKSNNSEITLQPLYPLKHNGNRLNVLNKEKNDNYSNNKNKNVESLPFNYTTSKINQYDLSISKPIPQKTSRINSLLNDVKNGDFIDYNIFKKEYLKNNKDFNESMENTNNCQLKREPTTKIEEKDKNNINTQRKLLQDQSISHNSIMYLQNEEVNVKSKNYFKSWIITNLANEWENQPWISLKCPKYNEWGDNSDDINDDNNDNYLQLKGIIESLPLKIAFLSRTIQHIYKNSSNFLEGKTNIFTFPSVPHEVMEDIIYYLYYEWFHQFYGKDQENQYSTSTDYYTTSNYSDHKDITIPKAIQEYKFIPKYDNVFLLIEAALYFDLPKLIDTCADYIAKIFDDVDSFYGLTTTLINHIIKRLNIHQCLHAEQLLQQEKIEGIQLQKIYKKNYLKLLLSHKLKHYEFHSFNNSYCLNYYWMKQWHKKCILETLNKPLSYYRKVCLQYLTEQWIKNTSQHKWSATFHNYIKDLIQNEHEIIQDLCITLSDNRIDSLFLDTIAPIKRLTVQLNKITPDSMINLEMFIKSLITNNKYICHPFLINFDINDTIKSITLTENQENKNNQYNKMKDEKSLVLNTNLVTLNLSKMPLNQTSLNFLLNALNQTQNQSMLSRTNQNKYAIKFSSSNTKSSLLALKNLILCQCQLSLTAIEMILNVIKNHPTLQVLRLANNVKTHQIKGKSNDMDADIDDEKSEQDSGNEDDNTDNENGKNEKYYSKNTALSMTVLNSLLTSNTSQLQIIDLSYNKFPAAMLFQLISAFNNLQPRLHTMDLSGMDLGISCTELLAKNLKSYFVGNTTTTTTAAATSSLYSTDNIYINQHQYYHNQKSLKTLLLSNNKIRPKGLILLMKTILMYTEIKEIDLSHNLFTDSISDEFSELLKTCKESKLQVLGLAGYKNLEAFDDIKDYEYLHNSCLYSTRSHGKKESNEGDEEGDDDDSELELNTTNPPDAYPKNSKGKSQSDIHNSKQQIKEEHQNNNEQNFSEFSFGNDGCQKIIKNLQYYGHQLTSIDLSYQQIENNTLEIIATQLIYLPCLLHMDLQHNYITERGLISFIAIINKNNERKELVNNVKTQKINDTETIINLEYNYINFASCLEQIKIFNNNSKNNYIIYAKNQNNNHIYYYTQNKY
ncbi:RNI-like protein [Piromyces finnis]|uniref:RNI-like protein n=1 Tax=Piromyces finnis TaxID=1754191 RepID=A0A1Y1VJN5_9FUNG|nr:RNI-like protein [Piromyces finnis]|eukprot:ORX57923.1 RNI-like protein [Piromyces finnis]